MAQVTEQKCDVAIVGGGPGGYVAAIRASQLGLKVILVEREHLGGICLNWGCIPAKALLRTSEVHHMLQHLGDYGLSAKEISFDLAAVVQRSRAVSQKLTTGVTFLMKKNKITVVDGQARLAGPQSLAVEKGGVVQTIKAPHILLATGARARILPGLEIDENFVWSYKEAMVPKVFPKRLLVVGAGAIGAEFASFYRDMGAEVILVDVMPRILPVEDEEISAFAHKAFVAQGMRVLTGVKLGTVTRKKSGVEVAIMVDGKEEIVTVDRVISVWAHGGAWGVCDRRCGWSALACAQGEP